MIEAIKYLYPAADTLVDMVVQDNSDGNGPFIVTWNESKLGPKPTWAELAAVSVVAEQARTDKEESDKAKAELTAIDLASIRSIREWVVTQPNAPQILKDREAAAVLKRAKVKP